MSCRLIIPARYASTRLPQKLLLRETGKAVICHTVDTAVAAFRLAPELFSGATVATDHEEILSAVNAYAAAQQLPVEALMTRVDHVSGSDRIAEAVDKLRDPAEVIINIQGDEPELDPQLVVDLARYMQEHPQVEMATLAYPIAGADVLNPNLVKVVIANDGRALYFSRSPIPYDRAAGGAATQALGHVGIYAYRRETLLRFVKMPRGTLEALESLEQLRAMENGIGIYVRTLTQRPPKGIDTPEDYADFVARVK